MSTNKAKREASDRHGEKHEPPRPGGVHVPEEELKNMTEDTNHTSGPWSFTIHDWHTDIVAIAAAFKASMSRLVRRMFDLFPDDIRKKAIRKWRAKARAASSIRRYRRRKARRTHVVL